MDFFDNIGGTPCANCECEPALPGDHYCSAECRAEWEGETVEAIRERFDY